MRRLRQHRREGSTRSTATVDPRGVARGPQRDHLRHAHRRRRGDAGVLHRGAVRRLLPAADRSSYGAGGPRLAGRGADGHPGAGLHPPAQRVGRAPGVAARARRLQARLRSGLLARIVRRPQPVYRGGRRGRWSLGVVVCAAARASRCCPTFKERDFLMHWVTEARHIASGGGPDHRRAPAWSSARSPACGTSARTSARRCSRTRSSASTSARTGSASTRASTTTRPSPPSRRSSTAIPGLRRDVQTYLKERIREVLTGTSEAIVVRIYGRELDQLRTTRPTRSRQALDEIEGIIDLHVELQADIPQIQVEVDLDAAQRVRHQARRRAPRGRDAGCRRARSAISSATERPTTSRCGARRRRAAASTSIEQLPIDVPGGGHRAARRDCRRRRSPRRRTASATRALFRRHRRRGERRGARPRSGHRATSRPRWREIEFPLEYHPEMLGEFAGAPGRRGPAAPVRSSLPRSGSSSCCQASFGSVRLATLSFLTLPFGAGRRCPRRVRSRGGVISLGSLIGFFTVLGIAARNGIMMINHFQHLERYEGEVFGAGLVLRGARERLSPILMTALATGLALVPLAIAGDLPGHEIEHPMAIVILGRAGDVHPPEPVRRPVALSALCQATGSRASGAGRGLNQTPLAERAAHRSNEVKWCPGRDLNPDGFPHTPLKRTRIPIPPPGPVLVPREGLEPTRPVRITRS